MVLILLFYAVLVCLVFSKLRLVRWGWLSGTVTALIGLAIVDVFQQNGFQTIKPGTLARLVFTNQPGKVYDTKISDIVRGIGQGQLAASGSLARVGSVGITTEYPVRLDLPANVDRDLVRPGRSGTATVLAPNAGIIGTIAAILLWVNAYMAYL